MSEAPRIILCVDDDIDDQYIVRETLTKIDPSIRLHTANNGYEALQYLATAQADTLPSLIILDINMPRLDGKATLIELKKDVRFKNIPIVMFTTSSAAMDKSFCAQYQVPFITKPVNTRDLYQVIETILSYSK